MTVSQTWREQNVNLTLNGVTTIYFTDTRPNHIVINNNTNNPFFVGTSPLVSPSFHELLVPAGATKIFATPHGLSQLYLYYAGSEPAKTLIKSFEAPFTPQSISQSQDVINVQQLTGVMDVASLPPLPAGNNHIGSVDIANGITVTGSQIPDAQAIPVRNAGTTALATASLTILNKMEITTGDPNLVDRKQLIIYPPDTGTLYWGNDSVTVATGAPLRPGDSPLIFDFDPNNPLKIYGVSDTTVTIRVVESK
jgi:hypothetical protein